MALFLDICKVPTRSNYLPRRIHHARQIGLDTVAVLLGLATTTNAVVLNTHKPQFHWETGDDGENWIYDGKLPVAEFFPGHSDSRKLKGIGRPISLHGLRLIPGGPLFIAKGEACGPLCLSWRKHLIFYMTIDQLKIDDSTPELFRLYVKSHDAEPSRRRGSRHRKVELEMRLRRAAWHCSCLLPCVILLEPRTVAQ